MRNNFSIAGFAALAVTSIALAGTAATPANRATQPVQIAQPDGQTGPLRIAQADQLTGPSRVYCYNGLRTDRVDNWAPLYRGWVCIPHRLN